MQAAYASEMLQRVSKTERNVEARSCNRHCCGIAMSITQSVCVFLASGIQHAIGMRHLVSCDLSGCTTIFHKIS